MVIAGIVKLLDATLILEKDLVEHSTQFLIQKDIQKNQI